MQLTTELSFLVHMMQSLYFLRRPGQLSHPLSHPLNQVSFYLNMYKISHITLFCVAEAPTSTDSTSSTSTTGEFFMRFFLLFLFELKIHLICCVFFSWWIELVNHNIDNNHRCWMQFIRKRCFARCKFCNDSFHLRCFHLYPTKDLLWNRMVSLTSQVENKRKLKCVLFTTQFSWFNDSYQWHKNIHQV